MPNHRLALVRTSKVLIALLQLPTRHSLHAGGAGRKFFFSNHNHKIRTLTCIFSRIFNLTIVASLKQERAPAGQVPAPWAPAPGYTIAQVAAIECIAQ